MALNSLERLMVQLGLDYSEFKKGRAGVGVETKGMADDIRQQMAKAGTGVSNFAAGAVTSLAGPLAAFASVSAVVGGLRASIDRLDAVSDRVERLGIGAEKLQELSYYAEFSSVSIETLDGSIRILLKNMAHAASGNKEQAALFKALGVQVVDANGKLRTADDVMRDLSGKFAGMNDGAGKTALAMAVFGKSGADLLPMLNGGVAGMDAAAAKAREFGIVMGEDVVAQAAKFKDSLDDMSRNGQGAFNNLATVVLPTLLQFTEKILAATKGVKDFYAEARNAGGVAAFFDDKLFGDSDPNVAIEKAKKGIASAEVALKGLRERPQWLRDLTRFDLLLFGGEESQYAEVLQRKRGMLAAAEARKAALTPKPVKEFPPVEVIEKVDAPFRPPTAPKTESEGAKYLKQIQERGAALLVESQSTDKLSQSQKDLATFEQKLTSAKDGSFKANERAIRSQLDANIAAEKEIDLRDKQIKADQALTSFRDSLGQSEQGLRDGLAETSAAFGKSAEQRKIAAASSKIMRDADKLIADQMRAGAPLTFDYVASVYSLANAQAEVTRELMGRQQAEEGAQQLYAENQRFGLEYITDERERAAKVLEIDVEMWRGRIAAAAAGSEERRRLEEQFGIWYANQQKRPALDEQKKFTEEAKRQNEQIGESLTDALMRGFEDGKGFAENFKTTMKNLFNTMVIKPIIQPLATGAAGMVTDALGLTKGGLSSLSSTTNGGSQTGGFGLTDIAKLFNSSSTPMGLGDMAVKGLTDMTIGSIGSEGIMGSVAKTVFENAGDIAKFGNIAGNVMAYGGAIMSALNGDFGAAVGGAIGAYFGGPIGSFVGSKIGGLLDGPKTKPGVGNYGIAEVGDNGITNVADESFFYGDRRGYKGASESLVSATQGIAGSIVGLAGRYGGDAAGLRVGMQTAYSPDGKGANAGTVISRDGVAIFGTAIEGTNADLEKNAALVIERSILGGLQQANIAPQFANVLKGISITDATQEQIDGIKEKLEAVRTLNASFDAMVFTFPQLAKTSWDAREAIIAASGGLDTFSARLSAYQEGYYTEQERMTASISGMTATFRALGVDAVPNTRAELRKLMEAQDLTTTSGQQLYAALLGMSGEFGAWADYTKNAQDAETERLQKIADGQKEALQITRDAWDEYLSYLSGETDKARDGVQGAYDRESDALRTTIKATEDYIDSLAALRSSLLLGDLSTLSPEQKYAKSKSDLDALIARADGGDEKARGEVPQAIQQFLELSRSYNASSEAYQRDFQEYLNTAERLRTSAVSQLDISRSQLAKLDTMVEGILDVKKAVLSLPDALAVFLKAQATQTKPGTMPTTPAGLTDIEKAINDAYIASDGRNADADGLAFWRDAILNGGNQAAIIEQIKAINKASEYDGSHADGLAFVPKDGYRAKLHFGERVLTAADNRDYSAPRFGSGLGGNADVVAELRSVQVRLDRSESRNARLMETLIGLTSATSQQASREMAEQTSALRNRNSTLIPA